MEYAVVHTGIKGMKWGVRRYQNQDGSLTDEGRKRYGVKGKLFKDRNVEEYKKVKEMTDEELKQRIARLQLEQQYLTLSKKDIDSGKSFARRMADSLLKSQSDSAKTVNSEIVKPVVKEVAKELLKEEINSRLGRSKKK